MKQRILGEVAGRWDKLGRRRAQRAGHAGRALSAGTVDTIPSPQRFARRSLLSSLPSYGFSFLLLGEGRRVPGDLTTHVLGEITLYILGYLMRYILGNLMPYICAVRRVRRGRMADPIGG